MPCIGSTPQHVKAFWRMKIKKREVHRVNTTTHWGGEVGSGWEVEESDQVSTYATHRGCASWWFVSLMGTFPTPSLFQVPTDLHLLSLTSISSQLLLLNVAVLAAHPNHFLAFCASIEPSVVLTIGGASLWHDHGSSIEQGPWPRHPSNRARDGILSSSWYVSPCHGF